MLTALLIDAFVLAAVLESDVGCRKVTIFRLIRPVLIAGAIIPLYLTRVTTHGSGLTLELVLAAAGIVVGLIATAFMTVYSDPETGKPVSRAAAAYAAVWIVVIGARAAFTYGSSHWFSSQLDSWMMRNGVTADAITDALIFMAVTMILTRTIALAIRARRLRVRTSIDSSAELRAA
jgi:hypothetical protein